MSNVINLNNYIISERVDGLIDQLEEGGLLFCIITGRHETCMVFEIVKASATPEAWDAAAELNLIFSNNKVLQNAIFEYSLSVGSLFQEPKSIKVPHDQPTH